MLSYTKTRDNKVVQKYPLPRVLIHGQSDTDEVDDRRFFVDAVNKSVHDAMLNHNTTFLNTFHNIMKEVFYGYPIDQIGSAYYNIPHPSTQGTNQPVCQHEILSRAGAHEQVGRVRSMELEIRLAST